MRDYVKIARQYEADVISGKEPVCKWVRLAVERNVRDLARAAKKDRAFPYEFDPVEAARICIAAENLPHIKGAKAKVTGFDDAGRKVWSKLSLEPWQCWLYTTIFGWVRRERGSGGRLLRRFRVAFPLIPRKNAKSTMAAVVVLFCLTADGESGPECYSAATTRDQAKVVAETAWHMAKRSPEFCEHYGVRVGSETTKTLETPDDAGKFAPLSADAQTLDALNVSLAVVDELHAHKTRGVWDVLDTATGAREEPLLFPITTAGVDLGGICYELLTYLQKVLEGVLEDEQFFGVYYTIDQDDDWRDPAAHRKANPNYGVSVDPADLARKAKLAQHTPAATNNFQTKHLNVWVRAESTWMPMREWIALGNPSLKLADFAHVPCWIGVDLAEVRDIAALALVFRPEPKRYVLFGRFYLPEKTIEKSPIAQMSGWVCDGHIIETEGDQADFQRIEDDIFELSTKTLQDVREIDFDRALAAHMSQSLKQRFTPVMGKDAAENFVITVQQNVETMNPAMQLIESLTLSGHIAHEGNPAGNWMWSNVVVERNHKDEVYPRKAGGKDSPNKIDFPVATLTALSRASQATIAPKAKRRGARMWTEQGWVPVTGESRGVHP